MVDPKTESSSDKPAASTRRSAARAPSTGWAREIVIALATGAVAAIGTLTGAYFTFFNQGRELDIRMVELSLSMLSGEKGRADEQTSGGEYLQSRMFALRALAKYSGVPLEEDDMREWAESGRISFGTVPSTGNWGEPFVGGWVGEATEEIELTVGGRAVRFLVGCSTEISSLVFDKVALTTLGAWKVRNCAYHNTYTPPSFTSPIPVSDAPEVDGQPSQ